MIVIFIKYFNKIFLIKPDAWYIDVLAEPTVYILDVFLKIFNDIDVAILWSSL